MKTLLIAMLSVIGSANAVCQILVTNWVLANPSVRQFGTNVYDTARWPSTEVPQSLTYYINGKQYGGVPEVPLEIMGRKDGPQYHIPITFKNFPYDPKEFVFRNGPYAMCPAFPMYVKALMTECHTNFSSDGRINDISKAYDCGLPLTNKIAKITRVRIPPAASKVETNKEAAK